MSSNAVFCYAVFLYCFTLFAAVLFLYFVIAVLCRVFRCFTLFIAMLPSVLYAVPCCSALCYAALFRVVLCSPRVKNTMTTTAPQNMQVAFKFCSAVGDLTLFLPSLILFFRPSAPFSFSCRNYYTSFIALW